LVGDPDVIVRQTERTPGIPDQARGGRVRVQQLPREPAIDALEKRTREAGYNGATRKTAAIRLMQKWLQSLTYMIPRGETQQALRSLTCNAKEIKMMIKTLMLATAVTIGIGIAATSNASARDLYNSPQRGDAVRTYRPPAGQIYQRGFRDARTPEQKARRDFQLDGAYQ
jgi:hypothetical protein